MNRLLLIGFSFTFFTTFSQVTNLGDNSGEGGSKATYIGRNSGKVTTAEANTFVGNNSGSKNTEGAKNTFIGNNAGLKNITANNGTFIGNNAGLNTTSGSKNTFVGNNAGLKNTTAGSSTFVGNNAGQNNTSGDSNTFIGNNAGLKNTTASNSTFVGNNAGQNNTTGVKNAFYGYASGRSNTSGKENVYIGNNAGFENTNGSGNVFIGNSAGKAETSISNTLIISNKENTTPLVYGNFDQKVFGINTQEVPVGYTMAVDGKIITTELKVQLRTDWPDYVFKSDYSLPSLAEVETFIEQKGHLPNIPSAIEVKNANGILLGEMNVKLLQKVEELTLYTIQQEKQLQKQKDYNKQLEERLLKLEQLLVK